MSQWGNDNRKQWIPGLFIKWGRKVLPRRRLSSEFVYFDIGVSGRCQSQGYVGWLQTYFYVAVCQIGSEIVFWCCDLQVEVERFPSVARRRKCAGNCICRNSGCRLLYLSWEILTALFSALTSSGQISDISHTEPQLAIQQSYLLSQPEWSCSNYSRVDLMLCKTKYQEITGPTSCCKSFRILIHSWEFHICNGVCLYIISLRVSWNDLKLDFTSLTVIFPKSHVKYDAR